MENAMMEKTIQPDQPNKWKRPITKDNAKALRMIEKRLKKTD